MMLLTRTSIAIATHTGCTSRMRLVGCVAHTTNSHPESHVRIGCVTLGTFRFKSTSSGSSFLDTASDIIAALRWKAAHALTSSMSGDERFKLFERLDATKGKAEEQPPQHEKDTTTSKEEMEQQIQNTIAEAVATARAQEAQRNKEEWQLQRGYFLKEAEEAARQRVESDLAIQQRRLQFEEWQQRVALEKQKMKDHDSHPAIITATEVESVDDKSSMEHPILGPCILDLGYKRVHVVAAEALTSIPIWEKQVGMGKSIICNYAERPC